MIRVEVFDDNLSWKKKIKKTSIFFNKVLSLFPEKYKFKKKNISFSLLLSDNKKIKELNKKFRKKNKSTDVLSFPLNKKINKNKYYLGDIIISYQFMNKPKSINNLNFKKKVIRIFIHGFLHLLGYDHLREKDYIKMYNEELKIFELVDRKIDKIIKI